MSNKKILNLPDIDTSQPDTFETPDIAEAPNVQIDEPELVNENIERSNLQPAKAQAKFANRKFKYEGEDHSDSIYKKRGPTKALLKNQTVFDILPNGSAASTSSTGQIADETPMQKFQRLQYEVRTFREEMQTLADASKDSEVDKGIKATELTHHLADLQSQLSILLENDKLLPILNENRQILHYKQLQNDTSKSLISDIKSFTEKSSEASSNTSSTENGTNNNVKYELFYSGDQHKYQQLQRLSDLDKRLAGLENILGKKADLSIPLTQSMIEIKEKLALLDSTKIEVLQQKMKVAMKQMESLKVQDESTTKALTTNEKKITEIFELMNRWDIVSQQVPSIINRLYTLRSLHEEGLSFSNHLGQLETEQANITSLLKTNSALMNKMDDSFKQNMLVIQSNVESLEKRMNEINSKLNK